MSARSIDQLYFIFAETSVGDPTHGSLIAKRRNDSFDDERLGSNQTNRAHQDDEGKPRVGERKSIIAGRTITSLCAGAGGVTLVSQVARRLSDQDIMRRYRMTGPRVMKGSAAPTLTVSGAYLPG